MAVPKKRTSKAKSRSRKSNWTQKAVHKSKKAISLGKSIISGNNESFIYINETAQDNNT
uniref:Large ribosomal subunit protein bL32c n=1 Tax=Titanophycus setchellii TaxID=940129 RepID=A0A1G4NXW5_9FLOR|nr:Ribosomal protein L32 [Titanophycus setchellii]SCW23508.1 Ribosomal protein L32 [Titanophycus setchellii]